MNTEPLFILKNSNTLAENQPKTDKAGLISSTPDRFHGISASGNKNLQASFPDKLDQNQQYHFVSNGAFSNYHLIGYILGTIGPADLYFSTWAISERTCRELFNLKQSGSILSISALLDIKSSSKHAAAFHFIKPHCRVLKMAKCHAKTMVLVNDAWCVCVIGSSNFTENPRIEVGAMFTSREVGQFHLKWMQKEMEMD